MPTPEALLDEALSLTHRMLELARENEWGELGELEQRQSKLLHACFQEDVQFKDREAAAKVVREILDLHETIIETGAHFGDHIREEMNLLQKGRDASRAYLRHSK